MLRVCENKNYLIKQRESYVVVLHFSASAHYEPLTKMKGMLARKRQFLEHGTLKIDEDELDRHRLDELQKN